MSLPHQRATLGSVAKFINGVAFKPSDWEDNGRKIIRIQNLTDPSKPYNRTSREVDEKFIVRTGDILVSWSATLDVFEWCEEEALLNQHIFKAVPNPKVVDKDYFKIAVREALRDMAKHTHGSTMKHVNRGDFIGAEIPLPPLTAQKYIARVLEQADQLRKQAQQMERELNKLAQSLFLEMFGDPVRNPKHWPLEIFAKHLLAIDSGWSPKCDKRQVAENEWGVLKLGAVTTCTYKESENKKLPSAFSPRPKIEVKEGDLLFSRKNTYELVAATAYVRKTQGRIMLSDLIFRLVPRDTVDPIYLWGLLTNPAFRSEVQNLAGGAAGSMPNISKTKLAEKSFPLPGIELQRKYSKMIQAIWAQLDLMKVEAEHIESVFESLMQRAFNGELTARERKAA